MNGDKWPEVGNTNHSKNDETGFGTEDDKQSAGINEEPRPNGYAGNFYTPQDWQQPGWQQRSGYNGAVPPKPKKPKTALIAILLVVCLLGGVAAGTFLVAPGVQKIAQALPGGLIPLPQEQNPSEQAAVPSELPNIGGEAPEINVTESPIVQIAKEVSPTIVGVTVSTDRPVLGMDKSSEQESGYGTGIILSADGYIATNNHVVAGSDSVKVTLFDGTEYTAKIQGVDTTTDLAVLKIDATGLKPAALGNSDELQVGETVVAIGNPLGATLAGSVTSGIVSALNREITTNGYSQTYIQTDAAINPGNSGGALVNMKGEVIGINTLKSYLAGYDNYGVPIGTEGIGFAIPITSARPIIEQLISTGSIQRPGIGISCLVDETNQFNPSGSPAGVTVVQVTEGGPADTAGIKANDIITAIGSVPTLTVDELTAEIQKNAVGTQLELTVWRNGQEYKATVVVGDLNSMQ